MIDEGRLTDLLMSALDGRNHKMPRQHVEIKPRVVCGEFVKDYLRSVMREVISNPSATSFGELGHMQVVEHVSEKGYDWDKEHDAKDWSVVWDHGQPFAQAKIDEAWNSMAVRKAERGMRYLDHFSIVKHG